MSVNERLVVRRAYGAEIMVRAAECWVTCSRPDGLIFQEEGRGMDGKVKSSSDTPTRDSIMLTTHELKQSQIDGYLIRIM